MHPGKPGLIPPQFNTVRRELFRSGWAFLAVGLFSAAVNLLMLTGPLFMLQVYDRVLASHSVATLAALFLLVVVLYVFLGVFDLVRSRILSRIGVRLDAELSGDANRAWLRSGLFPSQRGARPLNDLSVIRQFLSSPGIPALFDLPWVPAYLLLLYLIHPVIGLLATGAAVVVVALTVLNELVTKGKITQALDWELKDLRFSESIHRNAEAILGMGMGGKVTDRWQNIRFNAMGMLQVVDSRSGLIGAITKAFRLLVQSALLAAGAYYAILQEITPGAMIAGSILGGRALVPIDQMVGNWKNFQRARAAYHRLSSVMAGPQSAGKPIDLPPPAGNLSVMKLVKMPPVEGASRAELRPILQGIEFELEPGDGLGVVGPSASGKSSLAKLLVGLWQPDRGSVRLDGASYDQWDRDAIGRHIGYLPQTVELLPGTVRDNIARFDSGISDEQVVEAAKLAGVHELILRLPDGYSTDLSQGMQVLSGGQVQRIALARAVLGNPPLVVLDEPNSNLDAEGDAALARAIEILRKKKSCVVVMAHRPSAIAAVNKLLMLKDGLQMEFGDKKEVLRKVTRPVPENVPPRVPITARMDMMRPNKVMLKGDS